MAASNPAGEMQFWLNGTVFNGIKNLTKDAGEMQFWTAGQPFASLFPPAAAGTAIKTWNSLIYASFKTIDSLAIASVKTWDGLA